MTITDFSGTIRYFKSAWIALLLVLSCHTVLMAQRPPRPLTVTRAADLSFGTFYQGPGSGSVSVSTSNTRTAVPDAYLFGGNSAVSAVFNISGNPGTLITLLLGGPVLLARDGGGGSMSLTIGPTDPASPFVLSGGSPATKTLSVGGTLTVGPPASNPPGAYSGNFTIIFNQN